MDLIPSWQFATPNLHRLTIRAIGKGHFMTTVRKPSISESPEPVSARLFLVPNPNPAPPTRSLPPQSKTQEIFWNVACTLLRNFPLRLH